MHGERRVKLAEPNIGQKWQRLPLLGAGSFAPKFNFFLACLYCQEELKTKILLKMTQFSFQSPYSKNVVPKNKAYLLKQSVFV